MAFWWRKRRRTAGIVVSAAVHRLIRRGDAARGSDWRATADSYRAALDAKPELPHIWVQLGHALSELGETDAARAAYRQSLVVGGDPGEGHVHLGHVGNRTADLAAAAWHYGMALRHGRDDGVVAIAQRLDASAVVDPALLRRALLDHVDQTPDPETVGTDIADDGGTGDPADGVVSYDISDLIAHFAFHRLPTGIQRFQVEVLDRALEGRETRARICCHVRGRDDLIELPRPVFTTLIALSRSGGDIGDPAWRLALTTLALHGLIAQPYRFTMRECLVNLGTSWSEHNYFLMVRNAKESHDISFIATVFDLIPVCAPQFCVTAITQEYINWLIGVVVHADGFLAISQSTAADLIRAARHLGHDLPADRIVVVPLDADFRTQADDGSTELLDRLGLTQCGYALMVSTIEPRKNHLLALKAWSRLLRRYRSEQIPPLVFAGRPGWLNERVYEYVEREPALAGKIVFVERASDGELAALYRNCAFTVYPSLYEGWGLPVTESLCYGKLPVVSDNSSLPEAGGDFASFFESNSLDDFVRAIDQAIFDVEWRDARERHIATRFRPRSWRQIADTVIRRASIRQASSARARTPPADGMAIARAGLLYPLRPFRGAGLWHGLDGGERFRVGGGWLRPESDCCRFVPGQAMLRVLPPRAGVWKVVLLLKGMTTQQCAFRISAGGIFVEGSIDPKTTRWSQPMNVTADGAGSINLVIEAAHGEPGSLRDDGRPPDVVASMGIAGLYLCAADDTMAFARVLQAGLSADPSAISTFSRPVTRLAAA